MTQLYKIGFKQIQLVKPLQENIGEKPGFTLVPASTEMKANRQRDGKIHRKANWSQPGKSKISI